MEFKTGKSVVNYEGFRIDITAMEERNFYKVEIEVIDYFNIVEGYDKALEEAKEEIHKFGE